MVDNKSSQLSWRAIAFKSWKGLTSWSCVTYCTPSYIDLTGNKAKADGAKISEVPNELCMICAKDDVSQLNTLGGLR